MAVSKGDAALIAIAILILLIFLFGINILDV